jgi:hypothetical protein
LRKRAAKASKGQPFSPNNPSKFEVQMAIFSQICPKKGLYLARGQKLDGHDLDIYTVDSLLAYLISHRKKSKTSNLRTHKYDISLYCPLPKIWSLKNTGGEKTTFI